MSESSDGGVGKRPICACPRFSFGTQAAEENPDGNSATVKFDLRFPGQQYDAATGVNYNYFRDYEAGTGRYVESDPSGLHGGMNTYVYAGSNSIKFTDSYGLDYWIEGPDPSYDELIGHESVCVGKYDGERTCVSFGAIEKSPTCAVVCAGEVYVDPSGPGPISMGHYRYSSSLVDAKILKLFDELDGHPGHYNIFFNNCSTFSDSVFHAIDAQYGGSAPPPGSWIQ
ncbi:MAG: RHS repeat-associated core domain-containing protein [Rhodanobacteraceae bacterium]|nr:RHS repeat-associated core domain-containing protein [Rhodanobacteraceae bacterium]